MTIEKHRYIYPRTCDRWSEDLPQPFNYPHHGLRWMTLPELLKLIELSQDKVCLEIGSYDGASTAQFGKSAKEVHAIEPYLSVSLCQIIAKYNIIHHHCYSFEMWNYGFQNKFDLIFIDGVHEYPDVERDFMITHEWLKVGGLMVFHDYGYKQGVTEFIEKGMRQFTDYRKIGQCETLIWFEKYSPIDEHRIEAGC